MKKLLITYFATTVGSAVLIPIGFIGPGSDLPGVFAIGLTLASFIILVTLSSIDWRTRRNFTEAIIKMRRLAYNDEKMLDKLDAALVMIVKRDELTSIAREIGKVQGEMKSKGYKIVEHYTPEEYI